MTPTHIVKRLRQPLSLSAGARCEEWGGGDINRVFRLADGEQCYAVKWTGDDSFSGINKAGLFALQKNIAAEGLAPMPCWLSDDRRLWVEHWYQSDDLVFGSDGCSESDIRALAFVLSAVHKLSLDAEPLDLPARWQHYIALAGLADDDPLAMEAAAMVAADTAGVEADSDRVLCHNDLSLPHILNRQKPLVVDWEYAAIGNRYFDVASCAHINGLSPEQAAYLYVAYADLSRLRPVSVLAKCRQQEAVVALTASLWYAALPTADIEK